MRYKLINSEKIFLINAYCIENDNYLRLITHNPHLLAKNTLKKTNRFAF